MANRQIEDKSAERELEIEHDTVDLTADQLRSISGGSGVFLNLEIKKGPKTDAVPHSHGHHRKP